MLRGGRAWKRLQSAKAILRKPGMPKRLPGEFPNENGPFGHMWKADHLPPKFISKQIRRSAITRDLNPVKPCDRVRFWLLAPGDFVRVVKGEHAGREGAIVRVDKLRNEVFIEGVNMQEQMIPESAREAFGSDRVTLPGPVGYHDVRLLEEVLDENENIIRVEVPELREGQPLYRNGWVSWNRWVVGENRMIPWPETPAPELKEHAVDAKPNVVQEHSFEATFDSPIPESVAHELHSVTSRRARQAWGRQYYEAREREIMERILAQNRQDPQFVARREWRKEQNRKNRAQRPRLTTVEMSYIVDAMQKQGLQG